MYNISETTLWDTNEITLNGLTSTGYITDVVGLRVNGKINGASIGDLVNIEISKKPNSLTDEQYLLGQVTGFIEDKIIINAYGSSNGISPGAKINLLGYKPSLRFPENLGSAALNAFGEIIWSKYSTNEIKTQRKINLEIDYPPPPVKDRAPIVKRFCTGIKAIDSFCTLGCGQRICLFAEPGVGKSSLIKAIAKNSDADINIIALIGERAREAADFIQSLESNLLSENTILIISTSDEPAPMRCLAAQSATRIAEYYRDQGANVLLQIDSLTRLTRAYRDVGLSSGETPVRRGYPPSVFAQMPKLIERVGATKVGTITAIYTVLLSENLDEDPMVEEIKGITDGHIYLNKELANKGHYPAIDVLTSLSRLSPSLISSEQTSLLTRLRESLSLVNGSRDLLALGANQTEQISSAQKISERVNSFLKQSLDEAFTFEQCFEELFKLYNA